jgi:S-DNA-T family DNA segregation ATPase FtsK/SpoIIIE
MAKKNTYKNQDEEEALREAKPLTKKTSKSVTSSTVKKKTSGGSSFGKFRTFVADERTHKVFGLLCMLVSVFMTLAFVSFFFTHKFDQSIIGGEVDSEATNITGKLGVWISYFFISNLGIGAFFLIPLLFVTGLNLLLREKYFSVMKWYFMSFLAFAWSATLLGFLTYGQKLDILGGKFGFGMTNIFHNYIGNIGIVLVLAFSMIIYLAVAYNMSFAFLKDAIAKLKFNRTPRPMAIEEDDKEVDVEEGFDHSAFEAQIIEAANLPRPEEIDFDVVEIPEPEIVPEVTEETPAVISAPEIIDEPQPVFEQKPVPFEFPPVEKQPEPEIEPEPTPEPEIIPQSNYIELSTQVQTPEEVAAQPSTEDLSFVVETGVKEATVEDLEHATPDQTDDVNLGEYDQTLDLPHFRFPPVDILEEHGSGNITINKEELEANKDRIVNTLNNYSINIESIKATVGPTVTLYEIVPAPGVRISKIKNLEDDIALSLSALGIRIIAPIPGRGTIGIEVPNQTAEIVSMRAILTSEKFAKTTYDLPIGLGKTISNETFVADLAKMPHLLMAGATGQGKSVGLNAILVSLLYKKHPSELKFVLVDPKKVELTLFNRIERHYLAKLPGEEEAIITDTKKVVATLNSLCIEMDNRYELLKDASVRNIKEYNAKFKQRRLSPHKGHRFLPYIVLVVDEFADLIMTAGKEVELPIARLAQLARAIGIHLIIATQRPSVNIITGTIKANFPARIAFRVSSKVDSRTILDTGGAEQLIGRGDMLLSSGSDLIRLQCAFVDTPEVEKLTDYIGEQRGYPGAHELPEYVGEEGEGKADFDIGDKDSLFEDAARIIVQNQQGSASLLQRRLKLGYNRAGRLIDQLESAGIVGPSEGSKARQVLIHDEASLEQFLEHMK